jgi:Domain of unknown function (DUF4260)
MKLLLTLEEVAQFVLSFVLYVFVGDTWWHFFAWLLAPDISMLGYLAGPKIGAWTYNFFHHKALAISLFIFGLYTDLEWVGLAGLVLLGHSAMDRVFGYGLKHLDSFSHTHLGWIGKGQKND